MEVFLEPSATVRQMSAPDRENRHILSVLTKRTYRLEPDGRCVKAEAQLPLVTEVHNDPAHPALLVHDLDLFPFKLCTDVVVMGHAHSMAPRSRFEAAVQIGSVKKTIQVIGDRQCTRSAAGRIFFSEPKSLGRVSLTYDRAYGGKDAAAEAKYGNPYQQFQDYLALDIDLDRASHYYYPRNPCGVGYLIEPTAEAVAQLTLPNLEDPLDPLTPERLAAGHVERWPLMPLPQGFSWLGHGWFPRLAHFGFVPRHAPLDKPLAEVSRGLAVADIAKPGAPVEKFNLRFANGASLGLQLPYLKGNETCLLTNLHPSKPDFRFRLPGQRPKIWTDGRNGKRNPTQPVLHTVVIEPDEARCSLVWRGSAPALRPYLPQELERMPFRVEW